MRLPSALLNAQRRSKLRRPNYWNNLASAYRETRQFDLAAAALDSNMKLAAPHGTWTDWHNLGTAYRNLGLMWEKRTRPAKQSSYTGVLNP